ncbi:MAG: Pycsar system effector family protein [Candidatus Odinarchaeota archaeon]
MNDSNDKNQLDYIKTIFSHNFSLIQLADTKANILLGINSILIPVIFGVMGLNFVSLVDNGYLSQAFFLNLFSILSLIPLATSFIFSILVIRARYSKELKNNIFFKEIISKEFSKFKELILKSDDQFIKDDFLREIYSLAKINKDKYKNYDYALWSLLIGLTFLILGYALIISINFILVT